MIEDSLKLLKKYYGYSSFRSRQDEVIQTISSGRDTFVVMPTGGGKSICYQIPALLLEGITLVISPLISLMKDQVDSLENLGIPASYINSSLDYREVNDRINGAVNGKYKLLYIAPERLESEDFCRLLNSLEISLIAVDEAHCVSQWGHDFRPSYRSIGRLVKQLDRKPVISAFTATATEEVRQDVISLLYLDNPNIVVTGFDRENLHFSVFRGADKREFVEGYIEDNKDECGIIYCATRKEVDNTYETLKNKGCSVVKYHASMGSEERAKSQDAFLYDDVKIMVATNAFGMGIDKSNVRYIIHYNMPKNMESYYQEAGRAGRDGEHSECILLFGPQDIILQKYMIEQTTQSPERRAGEYKKLQSIVDYCHTSRCLRKYILEYFGETNIPEECGNCSNCGEDTELVDVTVDAQKIISCILRMGQRFGASMVADVLKGSKNQKVLQVGFDTLSTYGIMSEYNTKDIRNLINLLVSEEYLYLSGSEYPIVKVKEKAGSILKGEVKVYWRARKAPEKHEFSTGLFEILKTLRKDIAYSEKVPPYIIFSDSTLHEMCIFRPLDRQSLLRVKGVGEMKLEKYGDVFLNAISEYLGSHGEEFSGAPALIKPAPEKADKTPSHIITLDMYSEGLGIGDIAEKRGLSVTTVQDHIIKCALEGHDVDLDIFIPGKYKPLILDKIKEIGAERLRPLKESLPDEVDYMAIKAAVCMYKKIC